MQPAAHAGTTQGNPSPDSLGNLVWHHEYVTTGGPLGSPNPWYDEPAAKLVWDPAWFGNPNSGLWVVANDFGAFISQIQMLDLYGAGGIWFDYKPVLRWTNTTGLSFPLGVVGTMSLYWTGEGGIAGPVDVDVVIAFRDVSAGTTTLPYSTTASKPTPDTTPETLQLPAVDVRLGTIDPGDEILISLRARDPVTPNQWVSLIDDVVLRSNVLTLDFDAGGVVVNESDGTPHVASTSAFGPADRTLVIDTVQSIVDDALGAGMLLVDEGTYGRLDVVVSNGNSPTGVKFGNAGEEYLPAVVYEGEFRSDPAFASETELALAVAETVAHEVGHKLGLGGHNCDNPPNLMTAGEKVPPTVRKQGARLFDASSRNRLSINQLVDSEPKSTVAPNDLAILNGSFCVPPLMLPDDGYLTVVGNVSSGEAFVEFGFLNSAGEFVYQGDSNTTSVPMGSHFDAGIDLAVRSSGTVHSLSNGGGCYSLSAPNPNNPAVSLTAEVSFPAAGATLTLVVQNAANTTGGLLLPPSGGCGTASFCTAKTALVCGPPAIRSSGTPSATATSGFQVSAGPARSCKSGILLYSQNAHVAGVPFQGGTLCLDPMGLRRAGSTNSMGVPGPGCDGEFSLDVNAFAQGMWSVPACDGSPSGIPPSAAAGFLANPGASVNVQYWGRDSQGTGSFVSDGLQFVIGP